MTEAKAWSGRLWQAGFTPAFLCRTHVSYNEPMFFRFILSF
ncbi:hypothetical protein [Leptospira noguchii]|nr:hypothetical protein [Leptospira noguchii]